jgi:hypothetical protein
MQATEMERSPGQAVVEGDHPPTIDAPGNLVLVLACGHAAVALDATLGITKKFHSRHGESLLRLRLR